MKCQTSGCEGHLKITHTYGTRTGYTQRAVCLACGTVLTIKASVIEIDPPHGRGAAAEAQRMKKAGQ